MPHSTPFQVELLVTSKRDAVLYISPPNSPSAVLSTKTRKMASLGEDLLGVVNKLQDLVFNTIGNDSLDLPQIVPMPYHTHRRIAVGP